MAEPYYPDLSAQQTKIVTSPSSTALLTSLGWAYDGSLRAIMVSASASGVNINFVGAAATTNAQVPTTATIIPLRPADAATVQILGDGSKTLNIINLNTGTSHL